VHFLCYRESDTNDDEASPSALTESETSLLAASKNNEVEKVALLLQQGVNPNIKNEVNLAGVIY
jgi:hypothetical protein